jgi:hypothetical protein
MNERIDDLIDQAGIKTYLSLVSYTSRFLEDDITVLENFAKLLIQDCVKRTIDVSLGHCEVDRDPRYESDHTIDTLNEVKDHIFELYGITDE